MRLRVAAVCLPLLACAAGCGSSSSSSSSAQSKPTDGPAPPSLVGVYTTKLTTRDLARNRAPELQEDPAWRLTISNSGGSSGGHGLAIANVKAGVLEAPEFVVTGHKILLKHEECAAGGAMHFYDNEYRFVQTGTTLRFTKLLNSCRDRVAETVLTSEPWKKQGG